MEAYLILIIAFLLDAFLGDPTWLPHLIVGYGKLISFGTKRLNHGNRRFLKGALLSIVLVALAYCSGILLLEFSYYQSYVLEIIFGGILLFYCLANKTLIEEGKAVFVALEKSLADGRKQIARIVGRDTSELNEQQIRIATLESLSENLSDGVIAPLFYFAVFGVPGAMAYKMVNTLDSMIGYRNEKYEQFGKFAAKFDDVANFIPARITAFLMLTVTNNLSQFSNLLREAKNHTSPNAGYPEAALALILDCRFGGPNTYHGKIINKPTIGSNDRIIELQDIDRTVKINWSVSIFAAIIIATMFLDQWTADILY